MARLLERIFLALVTFVLVLSIATMVFRSVAEVARAVGTTATPLVGQVVTTTLVGCFAVGLLVRASRWIQDYRRAGLQRYGRDRTRGHTVRRPTEEPRPLTHRRDVPDADPPLPLDPAEDA